jgi:hypothetical protein
MNAIQPGSDSIVDEIHTTRELLAELYHNDLVAYSHAAQEHCLALGFNLIESPRLKHWTEIKKEQLMPDSRLQRTPLHSTGLAK